MNQSSPVYLLIRQQDGTIRWIDVRNDLKKATDDGRKRLRQIEFDGKRFDVMSVRRWRDVALAEE